VYEHSSILKYCRAIVAMAVPCRKTTTSQREGVHRNNVNAVVTGALLNSRVVMYALCMTVTNAAQERLCHACKSLKNFSSVLWREASCKIINSRAQATESSLSVSGFGSSLAKPDTCHKQSHKHKGTAGLHMDAP